MRHRRTSSALALVLLVLPGCADPSGDVPPGVAQPSAPAATTGPVASRLVTSQPTLPTEPAVTADIATTPEDSASAWHRFGLSGDAAVVPASSALLFVGVQESGSCPVRLDDVVVGASRVEVELGTDGGPACTDDARPRTLVVQVARDALPERGFDLVVQERSFLLSPGPVDEPPAGPSVVARLTAERADLSLLAESTGTALGLALVNAGDVSAGTGGSPLVLHRWQQQRWVPAAGTLLYDDHPAVDAAAVDVPAGRRARVATVDLRQLEPGWYGAVATVQLGGRGGVAEVLGRFQVGGS